MSVASDQLEEDAPGSTETRTDSVTRIADAVSAASDFGAIFVVLAVIQLLRRRRPKETLGRLAAAGLTSLVLTRTLKHYFSAPRELSAAPGGLARTPSSPGFPSGHTLAAFTSALVLPRTTLGRSVALCFAGLVAWARVRVGHHQTRDVLAGASAGVAAGTAVRVAIGALAASGR